MNKLVFSMLLVFVIVNISNAKVICEGNCQGIKPQSRQDSRVDKKPAEAAAKLEKTTDAETLDTTAIDVDDKVTEKPLVGKLHGKKYVAQKYFEPKRSMSSENNEFGSNLPGYFTNLTANSIENTFVVVPKLEARKKLNGLSSGSILKIIVKQDIVASSQVPTPIVGEVINGSYKGSKIYGEAILDNELKRVLFNFSSLSGGRIFSEYSLKASGLDVLGHVGMKGDYHADDITFGIASFFATATAIAADSQVERSRNSQGDYVENPSAENATKKGVAGALGKVAERLSNRAMNAPGRTEIEGPLLLQVILAEAPYFKK